MRTKLALAAACFAVAAFTAAGVALASGQGAVYVNCYPPSSAVAFPAFVPRQHPARCDIQGEPEAEANLLQLTQAHWSHWGTASATANGRALNNHPGMGGPASSAVHVRLSRIRRGCHQHFYYTRAQITTGSHTGTLRLTPTCKAIPVP